MPLLRCHFGVQQRVLVRVTFLAYTRDAADKSTKGQWLLEEKRYISAPGFVGCVCAENFIYYGEEFAYGQL